MPSGAGHDAQMLARVCPTGMVFVPSVAGISHNPAEATDRDDLEAGAAVLLGVVVRAGGPALTLDRSGSTDEPAGTRGRGPDRSDRPGRARREHVVERLVAPARTAAADGAELVVFPELALTTFFPRWWIDDDAELDPFFETEMPGPETKPLFDEARRLGVGFSLGYAELPPTDGHHRYNTAVLVGPDGRIVGRYRKVHLPGHDEHEP